MSELKLQKLLAVNERLRQEEALERIQVSKASKSLVEFTKSLQDPLIKAVPDNPFVKSAPGPKCVIV